MTSRSMQCVECRWSIYWSIYLQKHLFHVKRFTIQRLPGRLNQLSTFAHLQACRGRNRCTTLVVLGSFLHYADDTCWTPSNHYGHACSLNLQRENKHLFFIVFQWPCWDAPKKLLCSRIPAKSKGATLLCETSPSVSSMETVQPCPAC